MKAILILLCLAVPAAAEPLRLVLGNQASPPYIMGDDELPASNPGLAVELAQAAAGACQLTLQIRRLPGPRLLQALEGGEADAALMLSYNVERARYLVYPMLGALPDNNRRLATLSYVFYARDDGKLSWDGQTLQGTVRSVGTNAGWSINQDLQKLGLMVEPTSSVAANFQKLAAGRIDAYATQDTLGDAYLAQHPHPGLRKLSPPINAKPYFLPFTRAWANQHAEAASCVWREIAARRDTLMQQRLPAYL